MAAVALFHNYTGEAFTGHWNGKPYTFKPGEKKYLPEYLAWHFAKHLTNRELIKQGKERSTSPKFPEQVPEFMELVKKAYTVVDENKKEVGEMDATQEEVAVLNKQAEAEGAQIVTAPDDDDDEESIAGLDDKK